MSAPNGSGTEFEGGGQLTFKFSYRGDLYV
jgi:hypothetical protein